MADEKKPRKRMGRPRIYEEPRGRITLELSQSLVEWIDDHIQTTGQTRTAWIEAAIREKLERDEATVW